jgi:hypothetical protein
MNADTRSAYRRTKRAALVVAATTLAVVLATEPGAAAPGAEEAFNNGTGSAVALGYKVNPTNGNLSFGVTAGEAIAGHQNTAATGQSRAINLGVIGVTLAGEGCDGGDPTFPEEDQPQPLIARSGEDGAEEGMRETEPPGGMEKFARATTAPFAEAITTIGPMGDPATFFVHGGRTVTHSGVIDGNTREALARTELGAITIGGPTGIVIQGMTWEAIHRSGAVDETLGSFTIGGVTVGGTPQVLPGDELQQAAALNDLLRPFGLQVTPPLVRVEQGIVFVDPLRFGVVPSQERDTVTGGIIGGAQPVRAAVTEAMLEADCSTASLITIADIVVGSVSGAGALGIELGGVTATTAEIDAFKFALLPALPSLPPVVGLGGGVSSLGGAPDLATAPAAAPAPAADTAAPEQVEAEPISDFAGERGGLMAMVAGGGLALLLATAEADRRKMRHALREIPLEA